MHTRIAVLVSVVALSVAAARFGGWAVVSVEDAPEHLVIGKQTTFDFTVRQHGTHPLGGLEPTIEARGEDQRVRGSVTETRKEGTYRASISVPSADDWTISIGSGFGRSRGQLLPIPAVAAAANGGAMLPAPERGRRLFAAKGCVTCHVHGAVDVRGEVTGVGPDLTEKRFAADYLAKFLADPSIKPASANLARMPNPALREREIASLVAFLNDPVRLTRR